MAGTLPAVEAREADPRPREFQQLVDGDGGQTAQSQAATSGEVGERPADEGLPASKLAARAASGGVTPTWPVKRQHAAQTAAASAARPYVVTFRSGINRAAQVSKARASGIEVTTVYNSVVKGMAAQLTADQVSDLRSDPGVAAVEPDVILKARTVQNPVTWGLDRIDQHSLPLNNSYGYGTTAASVRAYVVDSGVRATHSEFDGRVVDGFDAVEDGYGTDDCNGHGTHVAGTIGGRTYGVAKDVQIVPVRVLDCSGSGYLSWALAGFDWIAANAQAPAVVNFSVGGDASASLDSATAALVSSGFTVVTAAGNDEVDACTQSPSRVAGAITVGATTRTDARPTWSNFGSCLDLFAPGDEIVSAGIADDYDTDEFSGTSMASPHVAGAAALHLSRNPTATPAQVASALVAASSTNVVSNARSGSPNRLLFVDAGPTPLPPLPVGVSASTIALPQGDGVADTSTIRVVSPVFDPFGPGQGLAGQRTFTIAVTAGSDPSFAVDPTVRMIEGRDPCDLTVVQPAGRCLVQEIWTFEWNGRASGGEPAELGEYGIMDGETQLGVVQVRNLELTDVRADRAAPFIVAPYADGQFDTLKVTVSGVSNAGTPMAATGYAELTDDTGAILHDRIDFDSTPKESHEVDFSLQGKPYGAYLLTVQLVDDGVVVERSFAVTSVPTEVTGVRAALDTNSLFPYADGFRDRATVTLTTTTSTGTAIRVTGTAVIYRAGKAVRSLPVAAGKTTVTWDGRVGGKVVPGAYVVKVTAKGPQGTVKTSPGVAVTVSLTTARSASVTASLPTVYPIVDGFNDTVRFEVDTSSNTGRVVRGSVVIDVLKGSRKVKSWTYSTTAPRAVTWNGRNGSSVVAGSYTVRATVKGPEGAAVVKTRSISVSGKKMTPVSFEVTVTPAQAFDEMASGTWWSGYSAGSQKLWGCTYYGCDPDIAWYSWDLPSSSRGYSNVVVKVCTEYTYSAPLGRFAWTDPRGSVLDAWRLGNSYPACYLPTSAAPAEAFNGRRVNWLVGNVDTVELSYWEVKYFTITGKRYVLQ